ncbi:hypothetical protein H5410_003171 [Solanum commersonii]|uniref:Uncharacterized protein n=1 Tax=Solanum commersonii TaxID=4109 RepID=A0A9J6B3Y3_SOLCO|nr:hypothetical protein H5410_003171 [Solanum commersonii]
MNAHIKTQLTHTRINCAIKDSSCDSPLPKNLKLTILASNASLSSTKVLKCPHIKMTPHSHTIVQDFIDLKSHTSLALTKMNTYMTPPIGLPLFSQSTLVSVHSRSKRGVPSFSSPWIKGHFFPILDLPSLFTRTPT